MNEDSRDKVPNFARRLRAERNRLGLRQVDFAALGGVKLGSQHGYESGKQSPAIDYLIRLSSAGVDVPYVVTGEKFASLLRDEEAELVSIYASLSATDRELLLRIARSLAKPSTASNTVHEEKAPYRSE